jgi:hypothetical protein
MSNTYRKWLLLGFAITATSNFLFGQGMLFDILPLKNGVVVYSDVIQISETDKNELYSRAKKWFVISYKSGKDVIQLDDKESGNIIGKGNFGVNYGGARNPIISHTISISVKDGRYK